MGGAAWIMVVLAAALIVVALVVFVAPLGRNRSTAGTPQVRGAAAPSSSGALARGFGYLHVSAPARRGGVHERLARAFARIDAVDPHAAPRRIGEALVQGRLADAPSFPPAARQDPWPSMPAEHPGDVR